jgi:hypothetical protein
MVSLRLFCLFRSQYHFRPFLVERSHNAPLIFHARSAPTTLLKPATTRTLQRLPHRCETWPRSLRAIPTVVALDEVESSKPKT